MQNAETLLGIIRDRGKRGLPLKRVYSLLYNPNLYLRAYARLSANQGAMTPGMTPETVDGMSRAKIDRLIDALRHERFRWTPVRRVTIPKKNGKVRPLGLPTWTNKLLQEVMRSILEAYFEPQFSEHSHGFRPGHGCHTALSAVQRDWTGTKWFIEGDIKGCFDTIDHAVLLRLLGEKVLDNRFLSLIQRLLQAGYLEDWRHGATLSGTPQGGVISPILATIYLNELDRFVEQELLPAYHRGIRRRSHPQYTAIALRAQRLRRQGRTEEARTAYQIMRQLPSQDPEDPNYRRLHYVRYADDWLIGFVGPKHEAEAIKARLRVFLRDHLKLELSEEKTLVTHARSQAARFLGYAISGMHADDKRDQRGRRSVNGHIMLKVPWDVVMAMCSRYERHGKPDARTDLLADDDFSIIGRYGAELRGYVNYYALAHNVGKLSRLKWTMETSMLKTLANKHRSRVTRMARKYRTKVTTTTGVLTCFQAVVERGEGKRSLVAQFGGFAMRRRKNAILVDQQPPRAYTKGTELLKRLQADACELCGSTLNVEVHHVRKLADLQRRGHKAVPEWHRLMAARKRKTLVVCRACHAAIHAGRPTRQEVWS
ncbi:MAG: reverse transcriptase domain-containing protein [Acidobacteriota bacterium]|nr:reverse transcriptase domain-containing protein [Acidobacteriota bacterium]